MPDNPLPRKSWPSPKMYDRLETAALEQLLMMDAHLPCPDDGDELQHAFRFDLRKRIDELERA